MLSANTGNPWARKNETVGRMTDVLEMAERFGYRTRMNDREKEQMKDQVIENSSSLLMINLMKGIRQKQRDYDKVNLYIQKAKQNKHTADLTDHGVLGERIAMLQDLNSYMDSILTSKDLLLEKLQQPHTGDYLKIEANYRREACEVLLSAVTRLGQLASDVENITWMSHVDTQASDLQAVVKQASTLLAQLQTNAHSLSRVRQTLKALGDVS